MDSLHRIRIKDKLKFPLFNRTELQRDVPTKISNIIFHKYEGERY